MSWVTVIWSMGGGACLVLAVIQLVVWWHDQTARANLVFAVMAVAVAVFAALELAMMSAETPQQWAIAVRWIHVPAWAIMTSLVVFVRLYLRAGRRWLAWAVVGVRTLSLILNFVFSPNINYREITALRQIRFLGDSVSVVAAGVPNAWMLVAQLSLLLLVIFVVDATITVWRRGDRRQALIIGGSILLFTVAGAVEGITVTWGIIAMPLTVSLFYLGIVLAMSFELGHDVLRVQRDLAERLRLERLVAAAGAAFVKATPERLDEEIETWMQRMIESFEADRIGLFEFTAERALARNTHQATRKGVPRQAQEFAYDQLSWYLGELRAGRPVVLSDVTKELPAQAAAEREFAREHGTGAVMGFPVAISGAILNAIDCVVLHKTRVWSEPAQNTLRLIGEIFANALSQRRAELALRESEERMSLAAEAANLAIWEWDLGTNEVWTTGTQHDLLGRPVSEKDTLESFIARLHIDDRDQVRRALEDAIKSGEDFASEFRVVLPDGRVRWITARGRCVNTPDGKNKRFRGVSMDVTAQKDVDDLFRLATESSLSGVVLVNEQGHIILVNSQIEKLFGYRREELVGKPVDILVPERFASQHPAHRAKFVAAPTTRAMGAGRELFARRKDGSEFPVEIGLNPIQSPDGIVVLTTIVDITARKLAEAAAVQHREELGHLSRVAAMGELAASIAHELNQPLAGIVSNAAAGQRFIDRGDVDLADLRELLADINADGRRAGDVIRGIQSMVKKGAPSRQRVDLNDLVMSVLHMINPNAVLNSCELETSLEPDLPAVEADPVQLQQVLLNLIINAFDAMRDTPISRRKVVISTERNGDATRISVRDFGTGLPKDRLDKVFDHFFSTKQKGMGMGLTIVRSIIEAHGGKIVAENADGGGARFQFTLPTSVTLSLL
jgi:two-component system, LuxR family, sensor kinase FixL